MWQVCRRWCRCFWHQSFPLLTTQHFLHTFFHTISLSFVTIVFVSLGLKFSLTFSPALLLLFPIHTSHLCESTKTKLFYSSVALNMSALLCRTDAGCLDSALNCWDDKSTSAISFCKRLTDRDRDRERRREINLPLIFHHKCEYGRWPEEVSGTEPPAVAASLSSVNFIH